VKENPSIPKVKNKKKGPQVLGTSGGRFPKTKRPPVVGEKYPAVRVGRTGKSSGWRGRSNLHVNGVAGGYGWRTKRKARGVFG